MARQSRLGVGVLAVLIVGSTLSARQALTKQDSESLQRKLSAVENRGAPPPVKNPSPLRTSFYEREVNAYFQYDGKTHLPVGVAQPQITIADNGRLEGRAIVD